MAARRVSLTDFVDFVLATGTSKTTKVAQIKNRPEYQPAFDFWKPLREHIIAVHKSDAAAADLTKIMDAISDPKKIGLYPAAISGYRKFWGRRQLSWFDPPRSAFSSSGIEVTVNPELGLTINGSPHLIKLYFKADHLAKQRVDIILFLMEHEFSAQFPNATFSVLDVQRGNLITPTVTVPRLMASLTGELAYFASVWQAV